jgi:hypothetical protein
MASVVAIGLGLFARDAIGAGFANLLSFVGLVVGCLNLAQYMVAKTQTIAL